MARPAVERSELSYGQRVVAVMADGSHVTGVVRSAADQTVCLLLPEPISRRASLTLQIANDEFRPPDEIEVIVDNCETGGTGNMFFVVELRVLTARATRWAGRGRSGSRPMLGLAAMFGGLIRQ